MRVSYHEAAEEELLDEIGYLDSCANGLGSASSLRVRRVTPADHRKGSGRFARLKCSRPLVVAKILSSQI